MGPSGAQPLVPGVDFAGKTLNNAPDFSGNTGATYAWALPRGSLALRGELNFSSRIYFTPDNFAMAAQDAFVKENAFLTYESQDHWHVQAFVRNLSNKDTKTSALVSIAFVAYSPVHGSVGPPRTFGVEVGYKF
jgi:iron complex outermembrane receptor protein